MFQIKAINFFISHNFCLKPNFCQLKTRGDIQFEKYKAHNTLCIYKKNIDTYNGLFQVRKEYGLNQYDMPNNPLKDFTAYAEHPV